MPAVTAIRRGRTRVSMPARTAVRQVTAPARSPGAGQAEEHVLERVALHGQLPDPDAPRHEQPVDLVGGVAVEMGAQMRVVERARPGCCTRRSAASASAASGDSIRSLPVGASRASTRSWATRRPLAIIAARVQISLDLGQQMAREEDGGAVLDEIDEQGAQLVDALRVEPVRGLVEDQQARASAAARRPGRAAGACRSSRPARGAGRRRPGPPARARSRSAGARVRAACRRRRRRRTGPGSDGRTGGGRSRGPRRATRRRAGRRSACRGTACPSTSTRPSVGNTRPSSIRMVVLLPAPFGPRNPNRSPSWTSRSTWSTATARPGSAWSAPRCGRRRSRAGLRRDGRRHPVELLDRDRTAEDVGRAVEGEDHAVDERGRDDRGGVTPRALRWPAGHGGCR